MMREVKLTQGKVAIVDHDDYDWLNQWKWSLSGRYVHRKAGKRTIYLHRLICGNPKGMVCDHINGDPLDNRRSNLRICHQKDNTRNSKLQKNNKTGFVGVSFLKSYGKFESYIHVNHKKINLGYFDDPIVAAKTRDIASIKYFGEFGRLNFPEEK